MVVPDGTGCALDVVFWSLPQKGHLTTTKILAEALASARQDLCVYLAGHEQFAAQYAEVNVSMPGKVGFLSGYSPPAPFADPAYEAEFWSRVVADFDGPVGLDLLSWQRGLFFRHDFAVFRSMLRQRMQRLPALVVVDFASPGIVEAARAVGVRVALVTTAPVSMCGLLNDEPPSWMPLPAATHLPVTRQMGLFHRLQNFWARREEASRTARRSAGIDEARRELGLPPRRGGSFDFIPGAPLILSTSYFPLEVPRSLPSNVQLLGPLRAAEGATAEERAAAAALLDRTPPGASVVYIAMGSVAAVPGELVAGVLETIRSMPHLGFVWSLRPGAGKRHLDAVHELPANLVQTDWAPQVALLASERILAFVSHCGGSSSIEGLEAGVPLLCHGFGYDQPVIARRVQDLHAGLVVDLAMPAQLSRALRDVAERRGEFRAAARRLGHLGGLAGGAERGVALLGALLDEPDGRYMWLTPENEGLATWELHFESGFYGVATFLSIMLSVVVGVALQAALRHRGERRR